MSTTREPDERPSGPVVVCRNGNIATRVVHLPADDESDVPWCHADPSVGHGNAGDGGTWYRTDHAVYPNTPLCGHCTQLQEGAE